MSVNAVRVGVIGAGLIGGSVCRALRQAGHRDIVVFSPSPSTRAQVSIGGFEVVDSVESVVASCDVLFVCVPMGVQDEVMEEVAGAIRTSGNTGIIVTDAASVKGQPALDAARLIASAGAVFVPGHPMAGTEESGYSASTADLFDGATWVLCPEGAAADKLLALMDVVLATGARVSLLDTASHDAAVASVSHLPYSLAATLVNVLPEGEQRALALRLAAGSFRDGSRVAGSEPWLSASMATFNAAELMARIDDAVRSLTGLREALATGNDATVLEFFEKANAVRAQYERARSGGTEESITLEPATAVNDLLDACRAGARIVSVSSGADGWSVLLER